MATTRCIHTFAHRVRRHGTEANATHSCGSGREWQAPRLRRLRRSTVWGFRMKRMFGSAVLALALVSGSAALAHDRDDGRGGPALFARFDGIDGESIQKGHEGEIEIFNFSETFRLSVTTGGGGGGGSGKFTPGPIVFSKLQGKASIGLLRACAKGQHIPNVVITAFRQGPDGKTSAFYKITLKEVFVSAINETSSGDSIVDEIQLVYESGRWEVFDPPDATEFDGKTGKVNLTAPAPGRNGR